MAHLLVRERLKPGDFAVDATVGNGHDTVFLAECVGEGGRVLGFDIQGEAISRTRANLEKLGHCQVDLVEASHCRLAEFAESPIAAAMFNLGYLPSGDKSVITEADSTIPALEQAAKLLKKGGIIAVVVYGGHPGGEMEMHAVCDWAASLDQGVFSVVQYRFLNQKNSPPFLVGVEKR